MTRARQRRGEAGISTVEVVFMIPVIVFVLLTLAALGLGVLARSDLFSAADAAARAGSQERSYTAAIAAAEHVLAADLGGKCAGGATPTWPAASSFIPGGNFVVHVACKSPLLGLPGLPPYTTLHSVGVAPIDQYRGIT